MTDAAARDDRPAPRRAESGRAESGRAEPDWAALRAEFPVFERWVHLEIANKAPVGRFVDRAIAEFVDDSRETGGAQAFSRDRIELARGVVARFVGAKPETIAFAGNTSHALNFAAGGLAFKPGDNVLLAANEHVSNVFAWRHLEAQGVEVRWVPARGPRVPVAAFTEAMDARTRAATISWVGYLTGYRADVRALAEVCRRRGVVSVIDAIQAVGVLDVPLAEIGADVVACGAHKAMLGLNGTGFLYVREEMQDRLRPLFGGFERRSREQTEETALGFPADARRYEAGNQNYLGIWVMRRAAELLADIGLGPIEARVQALTTRLIEGALARGIAVATPRPWPERAGIVVLELAGDPEATAARLRDARILANLRGRYLRVSAHFYNNDDDIDRLLDAL